MEKKRTHYRDYLDLRGDGRIVIYRRADHKKARYTARLKIPNQTGYIVRSTKAIDVHEARRFAEDIYYELEGRSRRGEQVRFRSFDKIFKDWARDRRIQGKGRVYTESDIRAAEIHILPFFKDSPIDQINTGKVRDFLEHRQTAGTKPPSLATVRQEIRRLKSILGFARSNGDIRDVPLIKAPPGRKNARPDIRRSEWKKIVIEMRKRITAAKNNATHHRDRFYIQQYVLILANSGIRIGEARKLCWKDITTTQTVTGDRRPVLYVSGKTGVREVVCNADVSKYLTRLYEFRKKELGRKPPTTEPIFCHKNGNKIGTFKRSFAALMEAADTLYDSEGKQRVPYSLRHTYATMRLEEGVSVFALAANMGTSVEMIETYYGKKRTTTPKAATELTKMGSRAEGKVNSSKRLAWE